MAAYNPGQGGNERHGLLGGNHLLHLDESLALALDQAPALLQHFADLIPCRVVGGRPADEPGHGADVLADLVSGLPAHRVWFTSEGFADALVTMQRRYQFDGILINLPGRPPGMLEHITKIEKDEDGEWLSWDTGDKIFFPWHLILLIMRE
jgi:hypothetical protein